METEIGFWKAVAIFASVAMPFWNIPLIIKIIKRQSSSDISIPWVLGVWGCILLMAPDSLNSPEIVLRAFIISNLALFSIVVGVVVYFRNGPDSTAVNKEAS